MNHRKFRIIGLIFIITMVFSLTSPGAELGEAQGITLRIALDADPVTLDPAQVFTRPSQFVFNQLFEGMFKYAEDGLIIPAGATGYDVSVDGLVYTIHLREDAYWSDHIQVSAQHYVDGLLQASGGEWGSVYLQNIVNVQASGYTITITLDQASAYFPHILAIPHISSPVRSEIDPTERPFVSNGPYKLDEWVNDDHLTLTKNDYYWGKSDVQVEEILFLVVPDRAAQLLMYESDELDVSGFPSSAVPYIEGDSILNSQFHHVPRPGTYFIGLNTQLTPTDNHLFRMALASSINRQEIIDTILQLPWRETATGIIPPEVQGYQGIDVGYPFSPSIAQTYFDDSGVINPAVLLWYNESPRNEAIAQEVANMWNVLGVTVTLQAWDWNLYLEQLDICSNDSASCPYHAYRLGWVGDYLDAWTFLHDTLDRGTIGATGWTNTDYDNLLIAAAAEEDEAARATFYREAEKLLVQDDAVIIPIFHYDESYLIKPHIIFEFPLSGFAPRIADWSIFPIEVTNTNDTGAGSFRQAILDSNALPGKDVIAFDIPASDPGCNVGGLCTIQPVAPLPPLSDPVIIDGYTQPGASPNTNPPSQGSNAVLKIELDGSQAEASSGLNISAGASTVQGLVINRFGIDGIRLYANGGNVIRGNYIGTDITGTIDLGNSFRGVFILDIPNNTVGGMTAGDSNIISGNSNNGVEISGNGATQNLVQGNFIGTDVNGMLGLGNSQRGVLINEAPNNIVGGTTEGARNLISANSIDGIYIHGLAAFGNEVRGNYIGTDLNGTTALGNSANGVFISISASNNIIGGTGAGEGNLISANQGSGVFLANGSNGNQILGNFIGTDSAGSAPMGNAEAGVVIFDSPNNWIGGDSPGEGNVISANAVEGVHIAGAGSTGNIVQGNLIGTDASGTAALGNAHGLIINPSASNNTIGGTTAGAGNVISASIFSGVGINPGSTVNFVQGNYIGTDISGTLALGNVEHGIYLNASNNIIGGTETGAGNIISSNGLTGIVVNTGTAGNIIQGNFIGTDVTGTIALGNTLDGVGIAGSTGNLIGGVDPGARNVISGNGDNGVALHSGANDNTLRGNTIGADNSGLLPLGNDGNGVWVYESSENEIILNHVAYNLGNGVQIEGYNASRNTISLNSIHDNAYQGIVNLILGNRLLKPPVIKSMLGDRIEGIAPPGSLVEIFADTAGEGGTYLGEAVADSEYTFEYYSTLSGPYLTATATDGAGNTSEFSSAVQWVPDNCEINNSYDDACDVATELLFSMSSEGTFSSYVSSPDDVDWFYFDLSGSVTPGDQITISLTGTGEDEQLPANYDLVVLADLEGEPNAVPAPLQGVPLQGVPLQGVPLQGVPLQGVDAQSVPLQGVPLQGVETNSIPLQGVPLQGVPLQGVPLQGVPLQGVPLQGVPLQGVPLQGVGFHQGKSPEVVSTLYRGGMSGRFYVLVWSSTAEFNLSPEDGAYEVTVTTGEVTVEDCTTGLVMDETVLPLDSPVGNTDDPKTLILVHRPRMVSLFGENRTDGLLDYLILGPTDAGDDDLIHHPLVDAVVVDIGDASSYFEPNTIPDVQGAYTTWDDNGCNAESANLVTLEIKKIIHAILTAYGGSVENLVLVGNDKVIPFRRVPDEVVRTEDGATVPNEFDYQNEYELENEIERIRAVGETRTLYSPTFATLRLQYYLSDDFYADRAPVLLEHGYELSVPDMPIGRLVETPEDIQAYVEAFLTRGGNIGEGGEASVTSLTTGYSFLLDQAEAIDSVFEDKLFTPHETLISDDWTRGIFEPEYLQIPRSHDVNAINAHFDHWHMAPAVTITELDLISSGDLVSADTSQLGTLFFSVGCHAGLNFPDEDAYYLNELGALDFPQALVSKGVTLIGNWGFGYGDDAALAYSEELMLNFARQLGEASVGQALVDAKREYLLTQALMDPVHEKILMEAVYYGLPMWELNATVTSLPAGVSTSYEQETQNELTVRDYAVAINADEMIAVPTDRGTYYKLAERTQAGLFRPIQPKASLDIGVEIDEVAHGVLFVGGTYFEVSDFDPVIAMPTWTRTVPELHYIYEGWDPAKFWSLAQLENWDGTYEERLVVVPGQFLVDKPTTIANGATIGTERLYKTLDFQVYYGAGEEFLPPIIGLVKAEVLSGQGIWIKVTAEDPPDIGGISSGVMRVLVSYTPEAGGGSWQSVDLAWDSSTGLWEGIVPITGPIDFFVQALDGSGNVGMFAGNGYFTPVELSIDGPSTIFVGQPVDFTTTHLLENPAVLWEFGDGAMGDGSDAIEHIFTEPGDLVVSVRIVDPDGNIGETSFQVVVIDDPSVFLGLYDLRDYFADPNRLPDQAIDGNAENRRKTFLNKISAVLALIGSGELEEAIDKLQNDLRLKMDGCPPEADQNDWIIKCPQQYELQAMIDSIVALLESYQPGE